MTTPRRFLGPGALVSTAVIFPNVVFWVVIPYSLVCGYQHTNTVHRSSEIIPEDGSRMFLRNVRIYLQDYTVLTDCLISDPVLLLHGLFSFAFQSAKLPFGS